MLRIARLAAPYIVAAPLMAYRMDLGLLAVAVLIASQSLPRMTLVASWAVYLDVVLLAMVL